MAKKRKKGAKGKRRKAKKGKSKRKVEKIETTISEREIETAEGKKLVVTIKRKGYETIEYEKEEKAPLEAYIKQYKTQAKKTKAKKRGRPKKKRVQTIKSIIKGKVGLKYVIIPNVLKTTIPQASRKVKELIGSQVAEGKGKKELVRILMQQSNMQMILPLLKYEVELRGVDGVLHKMSTYNKHISEAIRELKELEAGEEISDAYDSVLEKFKKKWKQHDFIQAGKLTGIRLRISFKGK